MRRKGLIVNPGGPVTLAYRLYSARARGGAGSPRRQRPEESPLSKNLLRSTALVGQMTLVSRVLGLIRDSVIAAIFGASVATDAFFVAFKIPNLFRRLFAEGAFAQAFVPVLAHYKADSGESEVGRLVDAVFGALGLALLAVSVLGVLIAPVLIALFAPGFIGDADKFGLSVSLLRLTFPYLLFIALTALVGGVLNTYGRFAIPAVTPALLNIAMISAALWLAPRLAEPVYALGYGVVLGGVLQLGLQLIAAARLGLLPRPKLDLAHPGVRRILKLMGPAVFGVSVAQINFLVDTLIASFLVTGSISWLYYSDRLMEFPLGIFGIALATVILPNLSEYYVKGQTQLFSSTLDWALRLVFVITIPSAVGLAVLAGPILSTLFQYGALSEHDVVMAARSLVAYAAGLTGFILVKVLAPGFYARQDTRTPVRVGIIALLSNLVLNGVLVWPLAHAGLALATSLAAFINSGLLLRMLLADGTYRPERGWRSFLLRTLAAAFVLGAFLHLYAGDVASWTARNALDRCLALAVLVASGVIVYAGAALAFGMRLADVSQARPQV